MSATEKELGDLHSKVATALTEQVTGYDEPLLDKEGAEIGTRTIRASPAILAAAIAFLKNNNITASPSGNTELAELGSALAARRKRGGTSAAVLDEAAQAFATAQGFPLQ